jgi:hypothetical protein
MTWIELIEPPAELLEKNEENVKIKAPEGEFILPAEGEHVAKLAEFEDQGEQPDKFNPGQTSHRMQLIWQLKGGGRQYQWVKVSLHPMSRFYEIATALLQDNPPGELEVEDLIGKSAIITIKHYSGDDGRKKSKVVDIRPSRFKSRTLPPPRTQLEEEEREVQEDVPF